MYKLCLKGSFSSALDMYKLCLKGSLSSASSLSSLARCQLCLRLLTPYALLQPPLALPVHSLSPSLSRQNEAASTCMYIASRA